MREPTVNQSVSVTSVNFVIRDLTIDDLDAVIELEGRSFPDPWPREAFETLFEYRLLFKGAFVGGQLAGYVIGLCFDDYLHLVNIAVA